MMQDLGEAVGRGFTCLVISAAGLLVLVLVLGGLLIWRW